MYKRGENGDKLRTRVLDFITAALHWYEVLKTGRLHSDGGGLLGYAQHGRHLYGESPEWGLASAYH